MSELRDDLIGAIDKPAFMDRVNNPQNYPHISNEDGSISTHRMAVEVDENGDWAAFPTIVQMPDGKLKQFEDPFEAMKYNRSVGNTKEFGRDKDSAMKWGAGGYKTKELLNYRPEPKNDLD
jgi:hypothetical protein